MVDSLTIENLGSPWQSFYFHTYLKNTFGDGYSKGKNPIKELHLPIYQIFLKHYCVAR